MKKVNAQNDALCVFNHLDIIQSKDIDSTELSQLQIESYISKIMNSLGLSTNFQIYNCDREWCKKNAYAGLNDREGIRYIIYDSKWLGGLNSDTVNVESFTILAHEIGHQLSGHTLSLNHIQHEDALKYCDPKSSDFDSKQCNLNYINDYLYFLRKSREQELEADRFAGYLTCLLGFELIQVQNTYMKIMLEYDDTLSTHPTLSKRLTALTHGYEIAVERIKNNELKHDLQLIKGRKMAYKVVQTTTMENRRIYEKMREYVASTPSNYVVRHSSAELSPGNGGGYSKELLNKMIEIHGVKKNPSSVANDSIFFRVYSYYITHSWNRDIYFNPFTAIYIKDGILKLITLNEDKPRVVYQCVAKEDEINEDLDVVEAMFIEIYNKGIEAAIKRHNEDIKK